MRQIFNDSLQAQEWEEKVLKRMGVRKKERWLNKNDRRGPPLMEGELNHFYGKNHTNETKLIIGSKSKGRKHSIKFREKMSERTTGERNPMYGSNRTGEENPMWGKTHSDESKLKMKERKIANPIIGENNPMWGRKQPTAVCLHCGKVASKTNIIKWHNDNCKGKTS